MKLSVKLLKQFKACQDGIDFVVRNKLIGLDVSHIPSLRTDNNKFVKWFTSVLKNTVVNFSEDMFHYTDPTDSSLDHIIKFNENGDMIYKHMYNQEPPIEEHRFYDNDGKLIREEMSNGFSAIYSYDERGNKVSYTNTEGESILYQYDKNNNLIYENDSNELIKWNTYDERGNLVLSTVHDDFDDHVEVFHLHYFYDDRNNLIHFMDVNRFEYWKEFDENNNLIHYKDTDGCEYWQEFDENHNVIMYKEPDKRPHKIKSVLYPNGQLQQYGRLKIPLIERD
jgi:YD repeat-containing protein